MPSPIVYIIWNCAIANVVHHDFGLHFQGRNFEMCKSRKRWKISKNAYVWGVDICHRMGSLQMVYSVILTLIFKVCICYAFAKNNCTGSEWPRQICLNLYHLCRRIALVIIGDSFVLCLILTMKFYITSSLHLFWINTVLVPLPAYLNQYVQRAGHFHQHEEVEF